MCGVLLFLGPRCQVKPHRTRLTAKIWIRSQVAKSEQEKPHSTKFQIKKDTKAIKRRGRRKAREFVELAPYSLFNVRLTGGASG